MVPAKTAVLVLIVFFVLAVLFLGFFPLRSPRVFLNHRRAVASIRSLNLAERNYAKQHPDTGFACNLNDLAEQDLLSKDGLIDRVLAAGTKAGYHFEIRCPQGSSQKVTIYTVVALPVEPGTTGKYALCADQNGEIWYSDKGSATDCLTMRKPIEQKYK